MVGAGLGLLALLALTAGVWTQQTVNSVDSIRNKSIPPTACYNDGDCGGPGRGKCSLNYPEDSNKSEKLARQMLPESFNPADYWGFCECEEVNGQMPRGPRCEDDKTDVADCTNSDVCNDGLCVFRQDGFGYCVCPKEKTGARCEKPYISEKIGQLVGSQLYPGSVYGGNGYYGGNGFYGGYPNMLLFRGQPILPIPPPQPSVYRYFPVAYPYTYYPTITFIQPVVPIQGVGPIYPTVPITPVTPVTPVTPSRPVTPVTMITTTGCSSNGDCYNGGQCVPSPIQGGMQLQGQCQCQTTLANQGPQCQGYRLNEAVCSTGNIIGLVDCGQGGQCIQRGSSEAYCACPIGSTGVDCSGKYVQAGNAAAFPPLYRPNAFETSRTSFNTAFQNPAFTPLLTGYRRSRFPSRLLMSQVPSGRYTSNIEPSTSTDEVQRRDDDNDDDDDIP